MTITRQLPQTTALLLLVGVLMYSSEQSNKMLGQLVRSSMTAPLSHTKTDGRVIESDNTRAVHLHKSRKRGQIPLSILTHDDPSLSCPPPLVPVHDRIASANRIDASSQIHSLPPRLIPRIMHLSMRSRCCPPDLAKTVSLWQKALPETDVYFHDDDAIERLLRDDPWPEFPHLLKIYDGCIQVKGAVMVDIWRVLILYRYGGLYSDIDNWPLPPFTEEKPIHPDDSAFFFSDAWNRPSQWFMAMAPNHPIAYFSMYEILKRILAQNEIERIKPVFTTGPDATKDGYVMFLAGNGESGSGLFDRKLHLAGNRFNHSRVTKSEKGGGQYLLGALGGTFGDIVEWSNTETGEIENVTRKEMCERQSGVIHWT